MTLRGRLSEVPKQIVADNKEAILKMYYDEGIKQQEIRKRLGLSSVSIIAEILRRDMLEKIESFKKVDPSSKNYELKLLEVIKFLKNQRKMDYSSIALALGLEKARVFKVISSENSGLRNSLSDSERRDRNAEMVRLSKEEGLSVTEIGKRMGVSKQMVSRIFTDLGYKPIRGTRNIQARMGNIPELRKFIIEDCNAKLKEMGAQLRKVKGDFAVLTKENDELREKLNKVLQERDDFEYRYEVQKQRKNNALDEIISCQKRIDSLLRQLAEKNGGK